MSDTTFAARVTRVLADWLNEVNTVVHRANSGISAVTSTMYRTQASRNAETLRLTDFMTTAQRADYIAGTKTLDLTAVYNLAFAQTGKVILLPYGTGRVDSNLTEPVCSAIVGEGENYSKIAANTGVTKVLPLGSECNALRDFKIEGNATAGAVGLHLGATESGAFGVDRLRITGFTGAGAEGMRVTKALKSVLSKVTLQRNYINLMVDGDGSLPTTVTFNSLVCIDALTVGAKLISGDTITFRAGIWDTNLAEAVLMQPGAGQVLREVHLLDSCRFEDNNNGDGTGYEVVADGSAAACVLRVVLRDAKWAYPYSQRSVLFTGINCSFVLDNPQVPDAASMIVITDRASGFNPTWPPNLHYPFCVVDTERPLYSTLGMESLAAPWIAWTPTYASNLGNAGATFTGTPTTTVARFHLLGKTLRVQVQWSATLKTLTPSYLSLTLPANLSAQGTQAFTPAIVKDNGVYEAGSVHGNAGLLLLERLQLVNFTTDGAVGGFIDATIEMET